MLPLALSDIAEIQRIINKVDSLRGTGVTNLPNTISINIPMPNTRYPVSTGTKVTLAKVTAITPTSNAPPLKYTLRTGYWSAPTSTSRGTWVDTSNSTDAFAWLGQSLVPPGVGDEVRLIPAGVDATVTPNVAYYEIISAPGTFRVWLTQNGGSNGDDGSTTTAAYSSYTYDVFLDSGKTIKIGTAVTVVFHRLVTIAVTASTNAIARITGDTVEIISIDEYVARGSC